LQHALAEAQSQLAEALDQQSATSEILKSINGAHVDISSVFDAIARSAVKLCGAFACRVFRAEGELLPVVGEAYGTPDARALFHGTHSEAVGRDSPSGTAIRERRVVQYSDVPSDPGVPKKYRERARARGYRALMAVPMVRGEVVLGTITVARQEAVPFSEPQVALVKTFADQAVIAIENVRLFNELRAKNQALTAAHAQVTEALEQQTATSEILRAIAQTQTDAQPVFDTIVRAAARLCDAPVSALFLTDGRMLYHRADHGSSPEALAAQRGRFPRVVEMDTTPGMAILTRTVAHVPDTEEPSAPDFVRQSGRRLGFRTVIAVPMMRDGEPVGALSVTRRDAGRFSEAEVALLKTFADQAVIAIENVRLFTELQASNRELTRALDTQTATSDILRVISHSQTDVQPVFEAIVHSAVRLLRARSGTLSRIVGDQIELAAHTSTDDAGDAATRAAFPQPLSFGGVHAQTIRSRAPLSIADAQTDPRLPEATHTYAQVRGYRSQGAVPMLRHDEAVGAIAVTRREPGGFTEDEIALLQTFADQAVIAIENVRLFTELQEKNQALTQAHAQVTETLEQQTATAEILRVISSSPTDVQPVFDAIVASAQALSGTGTSAVFRVRDDVIAVAAADGVSPAWRAQYPRVITSDTVMGRAIVERRTLHVEDFETELTYETAPGRLIGVRTILGVPMLKDGEPVGVIAVWRWEVKPFSAQQIALLETFADQAVIAIENVRLFAELQQINRELHEALNHQTATSDILRVISAARNDVQPVFEAITANAVRLCRGDFGTVFIYDGAAVRPAAVYNASDRGVDQLRRVFGGAPTLETVTGRALLTREVVHRPDAQHALDVPGTVAMARAWPYGAIVSVPLVRQRQAIGTINVAKANTSPFSEKEIALLQTFADQAVIAIENVRLFNELGAANRELKAASQHKSEFLANMSHELRTPLNAVIGFSEVMIDRMFGELNEKQDEYLKDIHSSGQHLLSLINDILDLSKIEAGRMELELTDFDLPAAIDNALTLVRERAGRRGIALDQAMDEGLGQIRGDERKIKQVLLNLLSNAIKFTPDGGRISVRATAVDGAIEVSVTDTGVGIAPEDQEAIFEEFRQVGTAAKKVEGTGLGLALSRKFVELHGGRIWVNSQVGAGSTFTFAIPLCRDEGSQ
jgi:GAF domain-containing protein